LSVVASQRSMNSPPSRRLAADNWPFFFPDPQTSN
jgi:hypothetical protein